MSRCEFSVYFFEKTNKSRTFITFKSSRSGSSGEVTVIIFFTSIGNQVMPARNKRGHQALRDWQAENKGKSRDTLSVVIYSELPVMCFGAAGCRAPPERCTPLL